MMTNTFPSLCTTQVFSQPLLGPDKALRRLAKESALTVFLPAQKSTKSIKLPESRRQALSG